MRIPVTDICSYLWYRDSETMTLEDIQRQLWRMEPTTQAQASGTALHSILEASDGSPLDRATQDGYTFVFAPDLEVQLPTVREIPGTMELCGATISGRVDAVTGLTIWDHKLTKSFDAEKYHDSMQWRLYLQMFNARKMVYNVFEGTEQEPNEYYIKAVHPLVFYRYPGMESENAQAVTEYLNFYRRFVAARPEPLSAVQAEATAQQ